MSNIQDLEQRMVEFEAPDGPQLHRSLSSVLACRKL